MVNNQIINNDIFSNLGFGLAMRNALYSNIEFNNFENNSNGILLEASKNNILISNDIKSNIDNSTGLSIMNSKNNSIKSVYIQNYGLNTYGLIVAGDSCTIADSKITTIAEINGNGHDLTCTKNVREYNT